MRKGTKWKSFAVLAALGIVVLLITGCGTPTTRAAPLEHAASPTSAPPPPPANIPVYPGAKLQGVQSTQVSSGQATTWAYGVNETNVTLADVTNFYRQNMPKHGWKEVQVAAAGAPGGTSGTTVLVYQQAQQGTPTSGTSQKQELAIISAGSNAQTNPNQVGYVITVVK
ncbi:MAG TPA: hypothetical protein VH590_12145 [Ktedonobacterales bacterium]